MPKADRWAYATISADGGIWCVTGYYDKRPDGSGCSTSLSGYGPDVFDRAQGSGIPCVDYRPMDFAGYSCKPVAECHHVFDPTFYVPLADWLAEVTRRGAIVTTL